MAADTELLAMQYVYSLKDDMTRPLKNIGDRWERFKKRIASRVRLLEARKQASESQAKLEAMTPATKERKAQQNSAAMP